MIPFPLIILQNSYAIKPEITYDLGQQSFKTYQRVGQQSFRTYQRAFGIMVPVRMPEMVVGSSPTWHKYQIVYIKFVSLSFLKKMKFYNMKHIFYKTTQQIFT